MSEAIPGRLARLEVSSDGGTVFVRVGGIVTITKSTKTDETESTDHDSDGHREYLPGHDDTSFSVDARWKDGDPGQNMIIDASYSKQMLQFKFYMHKNSNKRMWSGRCFVTSEDEDGPLDETGALKFGLRGSAVVPTRQA